MSDSIICSFCKQAPGKISIVSISSSHYLWYHCFCLLLLYLIILYQLQMLY